MPESSPPAAAEVLFLIADTGGGHRAAARAVAASLRHIHPGRFSPVLLDPLTGPGSARLLRWLARLYGPAVRRAPWLWGAAYRVTDSRLAMRVLEATLLRLADRPVRAAVTACRPAVLVSFHPLTSGAAVRAARRAAPRPATVTVVTDLAGVHAAWRTGGTGWVARPAGAAGQKRAGQSRTRQGRVRQGRFRKTRAGEGRAGQSRAGQATTRRVRGRSRPSGRPRELEFGVPVAAEFTADPLTAGERVALRRQLGVAGAGFLAVLTGGGEGAGGLLRTARALTGSGISVVTICGRNERARRRLAPLAERAGGRLTVLGFVTGMADWLRCADVVVTKAGPGTIAEAACCGAAMLITSHLPGQEAGNVDLVVGAGAGRHVHRRGELLREIERLRGDPAALAGMRAASARLARPGAADAAAALIARLAQHPEPAPHPEPARTSEPARAPRTPQPAGHPGPARTLTLAAAAAPAMAANMARAEDSARATEPAGTAGPAVGTA